MLSRTKDDKCAFDQSAWQNKSISTYVMNPIKTNHPQPKFYDFGLLGGNTVSVQAKNMVDVESELSGRSYFASKCPQMKWLDGESYVCPANNPNSFPIGVDATKGMGCAISLDLKDKPMDTFTKQQKYTDVYVPTYGPPTGDFNPLPYEPSYLSNYDGNF